MLVPEEVEEEVADDRYLIKWKKERNYTYY
jgi:hypothetical protein